MIAGASMATAAGLTTSCRIQEGGKPAAGADDSTPAGGPLPVSDLIHADPLQQLSSRPQPNRHPRHPDFNGASQEGAGFFQTTTRRGRRATPSRVSSARHGRNNLRIETSALAHRILSRTPSDASSTASKVFANSAARKEIWLRTARITRPIAAALRRGPRSCCRAWIDVVLMRRRRAICRITCGQVVMRCAKSITLNDIVNKPGSGNSWPAARYAACRRAIDDRCGTSGAFLKNQSRLRPRYPDSLSAFSTDKMGERLHSFSGFSASICQLRPESRGCFASEAPTRVRLRIRITTSPPRSIHTKSKPKVLRKICRRPARSLCDREVGPGAKVSTDEDLLILSPARQHDLPSYLDMPDGSDPLRWSISACGLRAGRPACGPRLYHAGSRVGNTNARHHHDRRESV